MKKSLFLVFFVFFIISYSHAQFTQIWASRYNGVNEDVARCIATDKYGFVYVCGETMEGLRDILLFKYNPENGNVVWTKQINVSDDGNPKMIIDNKDNIYISFESWKVYTVKYKTDGTFCWIKDWGYKSLSIAYVSSIQQDKNGFIYVGGDYFINGGDRNWYVLKYDSLGNQIWAKEINGPYSTDDNFYNMDIDSNANLYCTGSTRVSGNNTDMLTMKIDSAGNIIWYKTLNGVNNLADGGSHLKLDKTGNVIIDGYCQNISSGFNIIVLKYSQNGALLWDTIYYDAYGNSYGIDIDKNNNIFVCGQLFDTITNSNMALFKISSDGRILWIKRYSSSNINPESANKVKIDSLGYIYITGSSVVNGSVDITTVKYSSSGQQLGVVFYNGPANANDSGLDLIIINNNLFVAGRSIGIGGNDFITIRYSLITDFKNETNEVTKDFYLHQNYPNPFNPTTNIRYAIPKNCFVKLIVFDALGRKVETLINEKQNAGIYETAFDASPYPSGVYFYRLDTDGFSDVKKMVVIK
jgi:hypothetical protein